MKAVLPLASPTTALPPAFRRPMRCSFLVDIWSVGCIMAEMLTGKTLFPGTDRKYSMFSFVTKKILSCSVMNFRL